MGIAIAARERANCRGMRVGAVLVMDGRVVSTGYNGTPMGMNNCDEGGCERCANRESRFPSGTGYDICICVHAEQNAILNAARFGIHVEGGVIYTTTRAVFGSTKELLQAKVKAVYYLHEWRHPDESLWPEYKKLKRESLMASSCWTCQTRVRIGQCRVSRRFGRRPGAKRHS